jgi:hypothetical protein
MRNVRVTIPKIPMPDATLVLKAVGRGLYESGERIATASREGPVPVNDGTLRSSIGVTHPRQTSTKVEVEVYAGGPAARYALFVHEGTLPHWAPIEPLKRWAKKVLGDENAAYAVQKKIAEHGTKPTKYLEIPWRAELPKVPLRIANAMRKLRKKATSA